MRQPSRFSEGGFESMKMGVFLLVGRTKRPDLHRTSPPAFFAAFRWQLGAGCSLDRCDNSRAAGVRFDRSFQTNPLLVTHFVAMRWRCSVFRNLGTAAPMGESGFGTG